MNIEKLLADLAQQGAELRIAGGALKYRVSRETLGAATLAALRDHKAALMALLEPHGEAWCRAEHVSAWSLDAELAGALPGGAANIQDVYPLSPLQEGMLLHHRLSERADVYVLPSLWRFARRETLDRFISALQASIDRHDILRTAFLWERLREPLQVVMRRAPLPVCEERFEDTPVDVARALRERYDIRSSRFDLRAAPALRAHTALDPRSGCWLLLLRIHHIVVDHTSMRLLVEEVQAHLVGQTSDLPLAIPYRPFVLQARNGVGVEEHEQYFRAELGDVDEPTAPYGLMDMQGEGQGIEEARRELAPDLARRLRAQTRQRGVSPASLFHLVWARVLSSLAGRRDVVFGTVLFGRMQSGPDAHRAMGLFINTLPLRVPVDERSVAAALADTHAALGRLFRHEHAPLALAQRCSGVAAPTPLFSALLNFRYAEEVRGVDDASDLDQGIEELFHEDLTSVPCTLSVDDNDGATFTLVTKVVGSGRAEQCLALASEATANLVSALEAGGALPLGMLNLLPRAERHAVVERWNDGGARAEDAACIHTEFARQARLTPDKVAVVHGDDSVCYAELDARARRLARRLVELGARRGDRVALVLERGIPQIAALLAVLSAGCAYVPIDTRYPKARMDDILRDCAPALILSTRALADALEGFPENVPLVDVHAWHDERGNAEPPAESPTDEVTPDDLAYIIYTSGSTGKPKGVMVEHRHVMSLRRALDEAIYRDHPACVRVAMNAPLAFDGSVKQWLQLLSGRTLVVVPEELRADPVEMLRYLARLEVDLFDCTPLQIGDPLRTEGRRMVRLVGGDAIPSVMWRELAANREIISYNVYGPTECTVDATAARIEGPHPVIGQPLANSRIYILDPHGQPAPIGVPGELHIGGAGVARGYLNRRDLTAERFLTDPFQAQPGSRLYKTGDLARWRDDGAIEFLGRNDRQVKLRGFRIELGEIESCLARQPGIEGAVVVTREDEPGGTRLVAYYSGSEPLEAAGLRERLATTLPDYMLPSAFVWLAALPRTPNGKLDRRALPAPGAHAFAARGHAAPRGPIEAQLAELWCELLDVPRVGRDDHFFELGGHSLLAVTLIERMRRAGLHVDARAVYAHPTLSGLAGAVARGGGPGIEVPAPRIAEGCQRITPDLLPLVSLTQAQIDAIVASVPGGAPNVQDIYPLAPLQEGMLFHYLAARGADAYLKPAIFIFESRERLDQFLVAIQRVVDRHDVLRTSFAWRNLEAPVQVVWRKAPFVCEGVEVPSAAQAASLDRSSDGTPIIDISRAPLLRARIQADGQTGRWRMHFWHHHLISDHTTLAGITREVQILLAGRQQDLPEPLPFRDFVAHARLGVSQQLHEEFFSRMLSDVREPTAAFGLLDVQGDGSDIEEAQLELEPALGKRLQQQARRVGVSAATLFHLAWARVVAACAGRSDVVFGTVLFGRMGGGAGADRVLGMFINTLPLRVRIDDTPLDRAARDLHAWLAELLFHEHAPLALAQRCSAVPAPAPLFASLLNYRYTPHDAAEDASGDAGIELVFGRERTNYPLTLSVDDHGASGFTLTAQVKASVRPGYVCSLMQAALESLASGLEHGAPSTLQALSVLPPAEIARLTHGWNQTTSFASSDRVHQRFERTARECPDRVALVHAGRTLAYGELNERANRLAHRLIAVGVRPDQLVALALPRGLELVVAVLAILKSGGAYVPLDPDYPSERLRFVLQDCAPVALVTDANGAAQFQSLEPAPPLVLVDDDAALADCRSVNPDVPGLHARCLAYVIYTSGSTGQPKGVMVEHAQVTRLFDATQEWYRFGPDDVWTLFHSAAFDFSVWELWGALFHGGRLVIVSQALSRSPREFFDLLCSEQVTVLNQTPSAFRQLMAVQAAGSLEHRLRWIIFGGEALEPATLAPWFQANPHAATRLVNMYGITETTVHVTFCELTQSDCESPAGSPIGRRIPDLRLYLLDSRSEPVPIGVAGEIHVGGDGLARGYLGRPTLDAERFPPDPFLGVSGERMYKSGDLGRWRHDGSLEYLGRNDFQVKVRGFRIELGEIEARLRACPGVRDAVVLARESSPGDVRLVAYWVGADDTQNPDSQTLRAHAARVLPDYMLPAAWVCLQAIPLTPNGKLDRRALPAPDQAALASREFEAPEGPFELELARIWRELLVVERVGRSDDFFELGGHSLLAMRLADRVAGALAVELPIMAVFSHPTLRAQAAYLVGGGEGLAPGVVALRRGGHGPALFLLPEITGELAFVRPLVSQLAPGFPVYGLSGPSKQTRPLRTIEAMASRFVELIESVQPRGPYNLAGWSIGGIFAYEVARQLLGKDESVSFLGLIDTYVPRDLPEEPGRLAEPSRAELAELLAAGRGGQTRASIEAILEGVRAGAALEDLLAALHAQGVVSPEIDATYVRAWLGHMAAAVRAMRRYRPIELPLRLHLIAAADNPPSDESGREPWLAWDRVIPTERIEVTSVPGEHDQLMNEPFVAGVGAAVSAALERGRDEVWQVHPNDSPLVTLQTGRAQRPLLVCFPGAGAAATAFTHLVSALPCEQPVVAAHPRGLLTGDVPHGTVEAAARAYLAALDATHAGREWHLVGHSFGGWLALELALLMQGSGRRPASLTIVDSRLPEMKEAPEYDEVDAMLVLVSLMQQRTGQPAGITEADLRALCSADRLRRLHESAARIGFFPRRFDAAVIRNVVRCLHAHVCTRYRPRETYGAAVQLVTVRELNSPLSTVPRSSDETVAEWRRAAPDLVHWQAPGNHMTVLMPPHVGALANRLLAMLSANGRPGVY